MIKTNYIIDLYVIQAQENPGGFLLFPKGLPFFYLNIFVDKLQLSYYIIK